MTADRPTAPPRPGHGRTEHGVPVPTGLAVLAAVAAVAGALSGASPVGLLAVDVLWDAAFSAVLVLAASRARRLPTTVLGGIAGVVALGGGPLAAVLGVASLALTIVVALTNRRERLLGGLLGLLAGQALLHGPSYGPSWLPTLVAAVAVAPVLVSAWRVARSRERRIAQWVALALAAVLVIGAGTAAAAAFQSRRHLDTAARLAEDGLDQLRDGDTAAAADSFSKAQYQFERASDALDGPLGLPGRVVPGVAQNLEAVRRVSAAGQELGFTASQAAATADWRQLTATGGAVDLATVAAMQAPVAASSAALDEALATVADVRGPWLVPPLDDQLDDLDRRLGDAAEEASIAAEGLAVAPGLLGADGPTRYFVAFATPGESRNAGGFAGAYGTVVADGGSLSIDRTGATMTGLVPAEGDAFDLQLTDEWQQIYGGYDVARFPGNLTASPDWPTDAAVAAQIYAQSEGGAPVDGVIYADPAALAALLELTGPVEVPGVPEPLDAGNVEQYLLVDQYVQYEGNSANEERKEVLGDVARAVFDALVARPLPGVRTLSDVLGSAVAGGHLRVVSLTDPDAAAFLDRVGLSGAFGAIQGGDVLSLRSSNLLASKLDAFLRRDVTASVEVDPTTGEVTTTVEVVLHNDAPAEGLPDYILGTGTEVPPGTNRDLLTLYSPLGLDAVELDGNPTGAQTHAELGLHSYGVVVDVPPRGQATVTYRLNGPPPAGLVDTGTYELVVVPQPLAAPTQWSITVSAGVQPLFERSGPLEETLKIAVRPADAD